MIIIAVMKTNHVYAFFSSLYPFYSAVCALWHGLLRKQYVLGRPPRSRGCAIVWIIEINAFYLEMARKLFKDLSSNGLEDVQNLTNAPFQIPEYVWPIILIKFESCFLCLQNGDGFQYQMNQFQQTFERFLMKKKNWMKKNHHHQFIVSSSFLRDGFQLFITNPICLKIF